MAMVGVGGVEARGGCLAGSERGRRGAPKREPSLAVSHQSSRAAGLDCPGARSVIEGT